MNRLNTRVLVWLLTGLFGVAAAAPVAMRVEVEPQRQSGDKTQVVVVIQVSPEDRGRIGSNAIVRIELDEGRVSSGSPMRAVRLEDDGSIRVDVQWPPGEHDLRVQIEDPNKEDTGLWVGKVRIPDLSSAATQQAAAETASAPEPERVEPKTASAVTPAETLPAPERAEISMPEPGAAEAPAAAAPPPKPTAGNAPVVSGAAAAGAAAMPEAPQQMEEAAPEAPEGAPKVPPILEAAPEVKKPDEADVASPPIEEPAAPEEELPTVEPLRAEPPPRSSESETVRPGAPAVPAPVAVPMSAEVAARLAEWEKAAADTRDFSVMVMRGREPVRDVGMRDLRLRVGGSVAPIERLGGAENAPLLLGLAVDVASDEIGGWSGARGSLAPLAERAGGGRGRLFVATPEGVGGWGAEPADSGQSTAALAGGNVAQLVIASLEPFAGQRGRAFLVVLTDGRNEPTKAEWNEATLAAGSAGVPILVVALWDDQFSHRTRKNLKQLTVVSGGSLFLVQGSSQLDSAADRFGRLLDGSYALRFRPPSVPQGKTTSISVTSTSRELQVTAPKSIR